VRFRIGVNRGDVILEGQDLLGDGVNVAARLVSAAERRNLHVGMPGISSTSNSLSPPLTGSPRHPRWAIDAVLPMPPNQHVLL